MGAKRVHDACEVYDEVPSMHDAKAAQVIGQLYFEGASRVWVEASEQQRSHDAIGRLYRLYQKQHQQQQNRLEAALQRHWPELTGYPELDSVTLEELIVSYGSLAELSARAEGNSSTLLAKAWTLHPGFRGGAKAELSRVWRSALHKGLRTAPAYRAQRHGEPYLRRERQGNQRHR